MSSPEFDLLIAGAGPAGCTLALNLAGTGIRIGIIEKDSFPREKICGDALSGKVLSVMKRIPGSVYDDFLQQAGKLDSWGIRFTAPNFHPVDIPFTQNQEPGTNPPGYIFRRMELDNFLYQKVCKQPGIEIFENERISKVARIPGGISVTTGNREFTGCMIAGADGVHSPTRLSLFTDQAGPEHFCLGIRGYFENVTLQAPDQYIELIFLKELLPGYFWIFPQAGGLVNAGFGMLQSQVRRRRINLSRLLEEFISNHPLIAPRFRNARPTGKPGAHTLPLGTRHFTRSADRCLLLGDAAFLVDPFSGEGIGNAMASGEIAASILKDCFSAGDLSAEALTAYDNRIKRRFGQEFRTSSIMQRLAKQAWLFNFVVDKARRNNDFRALLSSMFTAEDIREQLTKPGFYLRLLFNSRK